MNKTNTDALRSLADDLAARQKQYTVADLLIGLAKEIDDLRSVVKFYADGNHMLLGADLFDTVSGEPQNFLCPANCACSIIIEDGSIAREALKIRDGMSASDALGQNVPAQDSFDEVFS